MDRLHSPINNSVPPENWVSYSVPEPAEDYSALESPMPVIPNAISPTSQVLITGNDTSAHRLTVLSAVRVNKRMIFMASVTILALLLAGFGFLTTQNQSSPEAPGTSGLLAGLGTKDKSGQTNLKNSTFNINIDTVIGGGSDFTATGHAKFRNNQNSFTALTIQNAAGINLLVADTLNQRIGINMAPTGTAALQVNGDISGTANLVLGGNTVCTSTGCIPNSPVTIPTTGVVGRNGTNGTNGADGCSGDCVALQAGAPGTAQNGNINVTGVIQSGATLIRSLANATDTFQVQDSLGGNLLSVDTLNKNVTLGADLLPSVNASVTTAAGFSSSDILSPNPGTGSIYNDSVHWSTIGPDGFVRFMYVDNSYHDMHLVRCTNDDCSTKVDTLVLTDPNEPDFATIQMGTDGLPRILYEGNNYTEWHFLKCSDADCTSFSNNIVASGNFYEADMVIGQDGNARIVYDNYDDQTFHFIECTNADCSANTDSVIATTPSGLRYITIGIGPDDLPRIVYAGNPGSGNEMHFAKCISADCSSKTDNLVNSSSVYYSSITFGADGFARIIYSGFDTNLNSQEYSLIRCTDNDCVAKTTTNLGVAGGDWGQPQMFIGSNGFPIISHTDNDNGTVYEMCTDQDCTNPNSVIIDNTGGYPIGMGKGLDGLARIIYYDTANNLFKVTILDNETGIGPTTSLGINLGSGSSQFLSLNAINILQNGNQVCDQSGNCGTSSSGNINNGGNSFGSDINLGTNDNFGVNLITNGVAIMNVSNTGSVSFKNSTNSVNAFQVQDTNSNSLLNVNTQTGITTFGTATKTTTIDSSGSGVMIKDFHVVGSVKDIGYYPQQLTISGNYAYILSQENNKQLVIYDISNISNPVLKSSVNLQCVAYSIKIKGNYAYVGDSCSKLTVYDISDLSNVNRVASINVGSWVPDLEIYANYVYLLDPNNTQVKIYDITNPLSPNNLGSFSTNSPDYHIQVSGSSAYIYNDNVDNINIYDLTNPTAPALVGQIPSQGNNKVKLSGSLLYLADASATLSIYDISVPSNPTLINQSSLNFASPGGVEISNNILYLLFNESIRAYDLYSPTNPVLIADTSIPNNSYNYLNVFKDTAFFIDLSNMDMLMYQIATSTTTLQTDALKVQNDSTFLGNINIFGTVNSYNYSNLMPQALGNLNVNANTHVISPNNSDTHSSNNSVLGNDGFTRLVYDGGGTTYYERCLDASCSQYHTNHIDYQSPNTDWNPAITLGSDGFARITFTATSFTSNGSYGLVLARCTDDDCSNPVLTVLDDGTNGTDYNPEISIGVNGFPDIVYHSQFYNGSYTYSIQYAHCTDADCTSPAIRTILSNSSSGFGSPYITNGSDSLEHLTFYDNPSQTLKYVSCNDAACTAPVITSIAGTGDTTANPIKFATDGFARIATRDTTLNSVEYIKCTNLSCSTKVATDIASTAVHQISALNLNSSGLARITYSDYFSDGNIDLKHITCNDQTCGSTSLSIVYIDSTHQAVNASSQVAADGFERMVFWEAGSNYPEYFVGYVTCSNTNCTQSSAVEGTNIGSSTQQFGNIYGISLYQNGNEVCDSSGNCPVAATSLQNSYDASSTPATITLQSNKDFVIDGSIGIGQWQLNSNPVPEVRENSLVSINNGYIYITGGYNPAIGTQSGTYYAKLNSDGSTGAWSLGTSLPSSRWEHTQLVYNGYIYVIGGQSGNGSSTAQSTVYYSKFNGDGTLGPWLTGTNMPTKRVCHASVTANGYIYAIGGADETNTNSNTVYYAQMNANGSIGSWSTASNNLPDNIACSSTVVNNGYVYLFGGDNGNNWSNVLPNVYYAALNLDGSVGSWQSTVALPKALDVSTAQILNGKVYVIGGYDNTGKLQTSMYYSSFNVDGTLTSWSTSTTALPTGDKYKSATSNGILYITGSYPTGSNSVYYTGSPGGFKVGSSSKPVASVFTGNVTTQTSINSTNAFQVQNSSGTNILQVDTLNNQVIVGGSALFRNAANSTSSLQIQNSQGTSSLLTADTTNLALNVAGATSIRQASANSSLTLTGNEITDATRTANIQGDGLVSPDSSTGVWESSTNLEPMGGFEGGVGGWVASNGGGGVGTLTRVTSDAKFGSASAEWNVTSIVSYNVSTSNNLSLFTVGQSYTLSFWAKLASGTAGTRQVGIMNSDGSNQVLGLQTFTPTGSWQRFSFTFTAAITGNTPKVYFAVNGKTGIVRLDGVQLEQNSIATPYIETNGSSTSRSASRVQAPASGLNATQGWVAIRMRMGYNSIADTRTPNIWGWTNAADNDGIHAFIQDNNPTSTFYLRRGTSHNVHDDVLINFTFNKGDMITAIYRWDASKIYMSINGSAFVSVASANIPSTTASTFDIGSSGVGNFANNLNIDSDVMWFSSGAGTLSNIDATNINAFGNTDPTFSSFASTTHPTLTWAADTSAYNTTSDSASAFQIQDATNRNLLNVDSTNGLLTVGSAGLFKNITDSSTAFQVQNAAGTNLFNVDTTSSTITLGSPSATPVILVLGNKNTAGDPTGSAGATYYNSNSNSFRCYENGGWHDCSGGSLGYASVTANQTTITTEADLTSLTTTVTVPANHRVRISTQTALQSSVASDQLSLRIKEGVTVLQTCRTAVVATNLDQNLNCLVILTPTSGSHTYKLSLQRTSGTGNGQLTASATQPAYILVEDIGQ